jgi:hypothetical protein
LLPPPNVLKSAGLIWGPLLPDDGLFFPPAPIFAPWLLISPTALALTAPAAARAFEMIAAIALTNALNCAAAPMPPP